MTFIQSNNSDREIDFEAIVPEKIVIPEKKHGASTVIHLAVRITNRTSNPIRFNFYTTLIPEIVDSYGELREAKYRRYRFRMPHQSDFPLVMPDERIDFPIVGDVICLKQGSWIRRILQENKKMFFRIDTGDGGHLSFRGLNLGRYGIRFLHKNDCQNSEFYNGHRESIGQFDKLWIGKICTEFVNFSLSKF